MSEKKTEYFSIQRKMVATITSESWRDIPHFAYMYEPEVSGIFAEYKKLNDGRPPEKKITFNTVMLKVIVEGLKAAPTLNAHLHYDYESADGQLDIFKNIDISMPTIMPNGVMMTMNLHNFENKNIDDMTDYLSDLRRRSENSNIDEALFSISYNRTIGFLKEGKIIQSIKRIKAARRSPNPMRMLKGEERKKYYAIPECDRINDSDIEQGTVTISNLGSLYRNGNGGIAMLEVIPPQVTVIGIGAMQEKPVIKELDGKKEIVIGQVLPMCIAMDHRALDFDDAVPFLKKLDEIFAHPEIISKWVNN